MATLISAAALIVSITVMIDTKQANRKNLTLARQQYEFQLRLFKSQLELEKPKFFKNQHFILEQSFSNVKYDSVSLFFINRGKRVALVDRINFYIVNNPVNHFFRTHSEGNLEISPEGTLRISHTPIENENL